MSSNTLAGYVVLAGFVVIGAVLVWQWRRADVLPDEGTGELRYQRPVLVRMRRLPDPTFHDLKAGWGSLVLTVRGGVISIRLPQFPRRLAATLSLDYTFRAEECQMFNSVVGWAGTPLLRRESVVLIGEDSRGQIQLAIAPQDHDLDQLRSALRDAGVTAES